MPLLYQVSEEESDVLMIRALIGDMLIGDRLMTTPAIRTLKSTYPEDEIHIVIPQRDKNPQVSISEPILHHNPYINKIHIGEPEWQEDQEVKNIDMDSMAAYMWAVKESKTIPQGFGHLCGVGIDDNDITYDYMMTEQEQEDAFRLAMKLGESKPLVFVARHSASCSSNDPKVGWANKCLPNYTWVEVAQWLIDQGYVPVAVGSEKEVKDVRYRQWPGKRLYGEPIRNVAALLALSAGVLSVDTGIRHLAASVGANLYCLSGTIPLRQIRCIPLPGKEQKIFEEYCPLQDSSAKMVIEGAQRILRPPS